MNELKDILINTVYDMIHAKCEEMIMYIEISFEMIFEVLYIVFIFVSSRTIYMKFKKLWIDLLQRI